MTRLTSLFAATGLAALALASTASAQDGRFAVGGQLGTPGGGVSVLYSLSPNFVVRGSYDALKFDRDDSYDDIDYNAQLDFSSPGAFIDWHPTGNAFFVSAGAFFGARDVNLDATPTTNTNIGGTVFTPAQIGNLTGKIELESTAPFVGIGYDNTFTSPGHWGFRLLAGAAFGDEPQVDLNASGGTLSNDPTFQAQLAQEEADIQDDADNFKVLPVVQVGVTYRF
ncbi:hypothetical protein [Brevundimonas goettingensis]|jgi:hypothetical protein|uniref:Outer membrane protein beta-barrel domain-containing protein n=1 Tax=Brevundimonas goettingensis TaxID=2774190 RepID=A0A975C025_9CAUL|nr:hypothetical protein [Brevundimonas goettingensis]QTC90332.1 hypothetical protein IFJ75_13745 [Brevundimonas goettingensis]